MLSAFEDLKNRVIDRGLCTGCGTCVGICARACLNMGCDDDEDPMPTLTGECRPCGMCYSSCPGADVPFPDLYRYCFGKAFNVKSEDLGFFSSTAAAYATAVTIRKAGASGGVVTALLKYALDTGLIDCALVAGFQAGVPWRTEARIAVTSEDLVKAAQSKYTTVPTNALLQEAVKRGYKKIGIVGLPCHVHAIRKMQHLRLAPRLSNKIALLVGLLCGSEFNMEGTKHLLKEWCGVDDGEEIKSIQYRGGDWPGDFIVELKTGEKRQVERHLYIYQVLARYRRDRCLMCVDWSAELADISIGDFWNPQMKRGEELGHSSILVRTKVGSQLLKGAQRDSYIALAECPPEYFLGSAGFEQKKHAAAFRLKQRQRYGWPTPDFHYEPSHEPVLLPSKTHFHVPYK